MRNLASLWRELFPVEQFRLAQLLIERMVIADSALEIIWRDQGWQELAGELLAGTIGTTKGGGMKPKVQTLGAAVAREHRDGGQVKLPTFIPLKIAKTRCQQGGRAARWTSRFTGRVAIQHDHPLLVALKRAFYW